MSNQKKTRKPATDPRLPGGSIVGPGGPHDKNAVIVNTERAVLLDSCTVAEVETYHNGQPQDRVIGMSLGGRINQSTDRAEILFLFDADGAASITTELIALASRMGPEVSHHILTRMDRLEDEDALGSGTGNGQ